MKLIPNWQQVAAKAWSIHLLLFAGLLSGIEAALPLLGGWLPLSAPAFAILTLIIVAAAFVARLLAQESIHDD